LLAQRFTVNMPLLMATSAFGLGRRCWSSPQQCYLHCLSTDQLTKTKVKHNKTVLCVQLRFLLIFRTDEKSKNSLVQQQQKACLCAADSTLILLSATRLLIEVAILLMAMLLALPSQHSVPTSSRWQTSQECLCPNECMDAHTKADRRTIRNIMPLVAPLTGTAKA